MLRLAGLRWIAHRVAQLDVVLDFVHAYCRSLLCAAAVATALPLVLSRATAASTPAEGASKSD